jgi:hypothetical protein
MWTKRNDHGPKNECVDLFDICPMRAVLKENKIKKSSLPILLSSFSLLQKQFH